MVKDEDFDIFQKINRKKRSRSSKTEYVLDIPEDELEELEKKIRVSIFKNLYTDILTRNITSKFKIEDYLKSLMKMFSKAEKELNLKYKKYFESNRVKDLTE